jgi:hypothetical protein
VRKPLVHGCRTLLALQLHTHSRKRSIGTWRIGSSAPCASSTRLVEPLYLQRQSSDRDYLPRHSSLYRKVPAKWPVRDRHNTPPKRVSSKFSCHWQSRCCAMELNSCPRSCVRTACSFGANAMLWHSHTARKFYSVSSGKPGDLKTRSKCDDQAWGSPQGPSTLLPAYLEGQLLRPGLDCHPQSAQCG